MRHTAAVDALLVLGVWGAPLAVVVVPPVVLVDSVRRSVAAAGLWLAAVALVVGWSRALLVDTNRVDATGGRGSWPAGVEWLVLAGVPATASVLVSRRQAAAASGTLGR